MTRILFNHHSRRFNSICHYRGCGPFTECSDLHKQTPPRRCCTFEIALLHI